MNPSEWEKPKENGWFFQRIVLYCKILFQAGGAAGKAEGLVMKMRDDSGQKHAWLAGGYLPAGKKIAAVITAVMTLAVLILRVALTPRMQDPDTGCFI